MSLEKNRTLRPHEDGRPSLLAAVSGTERGKRALSAACRLSQRLGTNLSFCSILPAEDFASSGDAALDEICTAAASAPHGCDAKVLPLGDHYADEEFGRAVALIDQATAAKAGVIVLGVHDVDAPNKPLSGSMTFKLLERTPAPVLIAANNPPRPYQKVAVAIDFSEVSASLLGLAARIAPDAEIIALHAVGSAPEELAATASLRQLLSDAGLADRGRPSVAVGPAKTALRSQVAEVAADLLVLGTRGRSAVARLILGSVASAFVDRPPCDVLVLRSGMEGEVRL